MDVFCVNVRFSVSISDSNFEKKGKKNDAISKKSVKFIFSRILVFDPSRIIRPPTRNPLTFGRTCQMVIFAPSNCVLVVGSTKNLPPKKSSFWKKSSKPPLVIGGSLQKISTLDKLNPRVLNPYDLNKKFIRV